jgi:hypothetical protein
LTPNDCASLAFTEKTTAGCDVFGRGGFLGLTALFVGLFAVHLV